MENQSSVKVAENDHKEKPSLILTDSDSNDDSESSEVSLEQLDKEVVESSNLQNGETENERKRRLDVFEFDEYDNIDEKKMKKERNFQSGSSRHVSIEKRKQFDKTSKKQLAGNRVKSSLKIEEKDNIYERRTKKKFDKMNNSSGGKKDLDNFILKSKLKIKDDDDSDGDLPISSFRQKFQSPPNEPIRSQGKKSYNKKLNFEDKKVSKSEEMTKKNKSISFSSESRVKVGKRTIVEASSPSRGTKREKFRSPEKITPVRGSVNKINRGSGTEKQKLREKLKNFLLDAGWKIDYRPRRGRRDYLDAVYISPTGSAYWSIVKAYDSFQKHVDSDDEMEIDCFSKDIKKLTRKTQKKIEREKNVKRKQINKKRKFEEESDENSASDEDEDDESSFLAKKNSESIKRNDSLKKKAEKDREEHKLGRCTLLVRSSEKGLNSENDDYIAYTEKRTLLSWLIDCGIINSSEKVQYKHTPMMLDGCVSRSGIHCSCCRTVIPVSKFEIHAGSKLCQPYENIYLESGVSLLQCQIEAWNKQEGPDHSGFHSVDADGDDLNDDTCSICGDGGDLICCDSCPSTFHQGCLDIEMLPDGDWNCPNCTCKFCQIGGIGNIEDEDDTAVNNMLTCRLCEKKYHESCCQKIDDSSSSSHSSSSFCDPKCHEIIDHLEKIIGVKHKLDVGLSWSIIQRSDLDTDASHRSFPQRVESNSKLVLALSVMNECFLPIVDRRSGINLINSIVYNCGSNISRLNFSGFYTLILERDDEIIAAASIRVRGTDIAEMPFIGTRHMYRRQGMCRQLLAVIESLLLSIGVKKLIIPAIAEHLHTWTAIFGFKPLDESHKRELGALNLVVFPGVDMLQKFLAKETISEDTAVNSGHNTVEMIKEGEDLERKLDTTVEVGDSLILSNSKVEPVNDDEILSKIASDKLDLDNLNKTSKIDEVVPDSKADLSNGDETVTENVSDKPVVSPVNVLDLEKNGETEDNVNHVDLRTQNESTKGEVNENSTV